MFRVCVCYVCFLFFERFACEIKVGRFNDYSRNYFSYSSSAIWLVVFFHIISSLFSTIFLSHRSISLSNISISFSQVQAEVQALGFHDSVTYPDTTQLKFVMLDEFFPMHSTHRNSFCRYIRTYYVDLLGVRAENVLTFDLVGEKIITEAEMNLFSNPVVDLTLLKREATNDTEAALKAVLLKVRFILFSVFASVFITC